jgi:hypothetical protein
MSDTTKADGMSVLRGFTPYPHRAAPLATPLKIKTFLRKKTGGLAANFAPAFRFTLQLENALCERIRKE